jgi:hypothetical protein
MAIGAQQSLTMKSLRTFCSLIALTLSACGGGDNSDRFDPYVNNLTGDKTTEMRGDVSVVGMSISPSEWRSFPASWSISIGFTGTYGASPADTSPFSMPYEITVDASVAASGNADCIQTGVSNHYICSASGNFVGQSEGQHEMVGRPLPRNFVGSVWQPSEIKYAIKYTQ